MTEVMLSGGVFTDDKYGILLLKRRDRDEWQLPGSKVLIDEGETAAVALAREAQNQLNVRVKTLRALGSVPFRQDDDVAYDLHLSQVTAYEGLLVLLDWGKYSDFDYFNVLSRKVSKDMVVSESVRAMTAGLESGDIRLDW